jgi:hypothetical protein
VDSFMADMPVSARILLPLAAVLIGYGTLMVFAFGMTGVAVVVSVCVVLATTHCYLGRHASGRGSR